MMLKVDRLIQNSLWKSKFITRFFLEMITHDNIDKPTTKVFGKATFIDEV